MPLVFTIAFVMSVQALAAGQAPTSCNLAIYAIDENGERGVQIISPRDVVSIDFDAVDPAGQFHVWRVMLNDEGASKNWAYTKEHIGKKLSITCDAKEIERATIEGATANTFVVGVPNDSKRGSP